MLIWYFTKCAAYCHFMTILHARVLFSASHYILLIKTKTVYLSVTSWFFSLLIWIDKHILRQPRTKAGDLGQRSRWRDNMTSTNLQVCQITSSNEWNDMTPITRLQKLLILFDKQLRTWMIINMDSVFFW